MKRPAALLITCVLLAALHTWPLVSAPHRYSRVDNGDYQLNAWAIAWVAHQVPRAPLELFNGNVFWPEQRTLAYSEAMLVQAAIAAPALWLGASPVLAYNLTMLAGFILTGWLFGLLAHRWTGSWFAAYLTASAAGFNAHLFPRLGHLQAMHVEFVAIILFAIDRLATQRRVRDALCLAAGYALQGLTSIYLMVFTTWATLFAVASRFVTADRGSRRRFVGLLMLSGGVAVCLLSFYLLAYYRLNQERSFARLPSDNLRYAGTYYDYLSTVSHAHYWWSARFFPRSTSSNFPGITVLALAAIALVSRTCRRDRRVQMLATSAVGCVLVSCAPYLPGYEYLHRAIPLFWAVRVQSHLGQFVLLMLALLAGFGAWRVEQRCSRWRGAWVVGIVLVVLVNAEVLRAPIPWRTFAGVPEIYDNLAATQQAVVAELPAYEGRMMPANATYMLNSTRYFHPLINGYSGFIPPSYVEAAAALRGFPDMKALEMLRARRVTHVVIHERAFVGLYGQERFDGIGRLGSLQPVAKDGDISIYRFR